MKVGTAPATAAIWMTRDCLSSAAATNATIICAVWKAKQKKTVNSVMTGTVPAKNKTPAFREEAPLWR